MAKDAHIPELVDDGAFAQAADKINLSPEHRADSMAALDALAAEHLKPAEGTPPANENPPGAEDVDLGTPSAEEKAAADKKAADEKAAVEKAAADKKTTDSQPEIKAKDGTPAAKDGATKGEPEDDFKKIQLPPHARPKSGEAFDQVKTVAREKINGLNTQVTELTTRAQAAESRVKELETAQNTLSPEIQSELEDLRKFKLSHDVESDPTFSQFSTDLNKNNESIFAKLKSAGISEENLAKIKEIGLDSLEWEPILSKMSLQTRRYIEAKLVENVTLAEKRDEALANARNNATEFLKERSGREAKELIAAANDWTVKLPWTAQQQVPANATPEQKAAIESANKFARESMSNLQQWLQAKGPKQIAELAVGTMIAYKNKADLEALQAQHKSLVDSSKADKEALVKERDALKAELDSIKSRGVPKTSGVPPVTTKGAAEVKPGAVDIRSGEDAMAVYEAEYRKAQAAA
jgi:hypothetical protein